MAFHYWSPATTVRLHRLPCVWKKELGIFHNPALGNIFTGDKLVKTLTEQRILLHIARNKFYFTYLLTYLFNYLLT